MKKFNPRPAELWLRRCRPWFLPVRWLAGFALCACSSITASDDSISAISLGPAPAATPPVIELELPPSDGDRYEPVGTNPFVMVAHDPVSTFATDADTASYDLFVRYVTEGGLPDAGSVRLEDYVNYFDYDYPTAPADSDVPFSIALAAAPSPLPAQTTLLRVGITGKRAPASEKKPANLVFLVDVSGSMQGADRLPLVQQVLRQTLDLLAPEDLVSIVSYASDTRVRLAPTPVSTRGRIALAIDALGAGGSTAGASGIELAYAQASQGFIQGGLNHVILCTDGDFNVGASSDQELVELIVEKRRTGITMTALGFGSGNLNDGMLEAVSNAGNGFYGVISSEAQAADYVRERLLSTLSLIAKDVKVQVELNPEMLLAYRLLGYENRAIADRDFRNDVIDAGEIGAGHQVTAVYELILSDGSLPEPPGAPLPSDGEAYAGEREIGAGELARVKLRYKAVDAGETDAAFEVSSSLAPDQIAADFAAADADLRWAGAMAVFAEILKHSPYARPERIDEVAGVFAEQATRDPVRAQFYELFERVRPQL